MHRLMQFPGAAKRDPAVATWMKQHPGELGAIARRWFAVMRSCGNDVRELLHDGHPTACVGDAAFGYVSAFKAHVNVGFFNGTAIPDPGALLEGTGRYMRHVKLGPARAIDSDALARLIQASYADMKSYLAQLTPNPPGSDAVREDLAPKGAPSNPSLGGPGDVSPHHSTYYQRDLKHMTPPDDHFRKLERLYQNAPINRYFEPALTVFEGRTELTIPVKPDFFHAAHAVHGSVYFKALDDAAFFAANSLVTEVFVLTVSFNVYLTRPVTKGELRAAGRVVHQSRNLIVAESELRDSDGRSVARGSGTFMRSQIPLGPEVGYL